MKKKLLLMSLVGLTFSSAFAQLSRRENDATVERLSARPEKGDMALTFAVDLIQDLSVFGSNPNDSSRTGIPFKNRLFTGDLLTYKYYVSDMLAIRGGLRLYKDGSRSKGEESDSSAIYNPGSNRITSKKYVRSDREFMLAPGVERHFAKSNIFDVYAAADVLLGFGQSKTVMDMEFENGDYTNTSMRSKSFIIGGELLSGFNIFIAHLPLSLGLEYGLALKWTAGGGKTKVTRSDQIGSVSYDVTYYTQDTDPFGVPDPLEYQKLSKSQFSMNTNQNVRLTINVYFSRKDKTTSDASPVGTQY